jgi:hypothetical protein
VNQTAGAAWQGVAPAGVAITPLAVYFDADGRPRSATTSNLLAAVAHFSVEGRTISVQPETGFVQVQ